MRQMKPIPLAAAFVICFLAIGIPYWMLPYRSVSLPSTLLDLGIFTAGFAALWLRAIRAASFWMIAIIIGAAAPAAVIARVIVETTNDPTSHNLWPFEVVIALVMGLMWSAGGASVGVLIAAASKHGAETSLPAESLRQ